jgi:hypothetical protein
MKPITCSQGKYPEACNHSQEPPSSGMPTMSAFTASPSEWPTPEPYIGLSPSCHSLGHPGGYRPAYRLAAARPRRTSSPERLCGLTPRSPLARDLYSSLTTLRVVPVSNQRGQHRRRLRRHGLRILQYALHPRGDRV